MQPQAARISASICGMRAHLSFAQHLYSFEVLSFRATSFTPASALNAITAGA
jgi:hypothetical protein